MRSISFIIVLLIGGMLACVEPIDFEARGVDLLVVEGFITDEQRVHTVRVSRTAAYSGDAVNGITTAEVSVVDELGNITCLMHTVDGIYASEVSFAGIEGRTYTLKVVTPDGSEYRSTPQTLQAFGSLDSVYFAQHEREYLNESNNVQVEKGIQYYIDYSVPQNEPAYFMWQWEATYQFRTRYHDKNKPLDCYVEENSRGFLKVANGTAIGDTKVVREGFMFVRPDYQYWLAYSLNVKQYSISEEAFDFYNSIRKQQDNSGSIFDPTPANSTGNIISSSNPDEKVLGFFGAYGATDKRTFVHGRDIPNLPADDNVVNKGMYSFCQPDFKGSLEAVPDFCFDCRLRARSTAVVPDFWP